MQYDVTTPSEYIQILDNDWRREKLLELRSLIKSTAPQLKEGISYKMLCYGDNSSKVQIPQHGIKEADKDSHISTAKL